jgi:hypothetical protein
MPALKNSRIREVPMFGKAVGVLKTNVNEFKEFAFKGNLIQLAIGVVLGGAFGKLITSFVDNVFSPSSACSARIRKTPATPGTCRGSGAA